MTEQELLAQILERLSSADSLQELFGADEIAEWPAGAFDTLTAVGLLAPAPPARMLTCLGCEQHCPMSVEVIPAQEQLPARTFIACDKRDDIGRVSVDAARLRQWQLSGSTLAKVVTKLLDFDRPPERNPASGSWLLGSVNGDKHRAQVTLIFDSGVALVVAGHRVSLADVLTLSCGTLAVDRSELARCVDNPAGEPGSHRYSPSTVRREARKLDTRQRYEVWQKEARRLRAESPKASKRWISQQIAKKPMAGGATAETIRKHIRKK